MNQITTNGLQVKTVAEMITDLTTSLKAIYGPDINLNQNSPDGQFLNIFAQAIGDLLEVLVLNYNSFSPDQAFGSTLSLRLALNGLARKFGSYTIQPILVTVDRALTLQGLDADLNNPDGTGFTITDEAGTKFILAASHVFSGSGSATLDFRAKDLGKVETTPNTITNLVTIILGVVSVNNPNPATTVGNDEETDTEFRVRHAKSFQLASTGPADAVRAEILAIPAVTDAFVPENTTGSTANGVGAHSIWAIVENGLDVDVAYAIYRKKAPGCGMTGGDVTVNVVRPDGSTTPIIFDRPITENLYIQLSLIPISSGLAFDTDLIKQKLADALTYRLNQQATIGDIVRAMYVIEPRAICTSLGVSASAGSYTDTLSPTTYQHKFVAAAARISVI